MLIENKIIKIIATNVCTNNNEKNVRSQVLNIQEVELVIKDSKAKGERIMNILTIINRIEYENNKLIKPKEKKLFSIPSRENKLNVSNDVFM